MPARARLQVSGLGERPAPQFASMNEGPLSSPVLRRDGAWLREVSPDGMDAGGAPAGRAVYGPRVGR